MLFYSLSITTIKIGLLPTTDPNLLWLVPLFGIAMVFAVLSILWVTLSVFKLVFVKSEKKVATPIVKSAPVVEEPVVEETTTNDDELVAVITAAVAAYIEQEEPEVAQTGFRVVSFRKTNGGKAWNSK